MCGVIDRRLLANFHIEPEVLSSLLPSPFRPKIFRGCAIGGICMIRLRDIRPRRWPRAVGLASENAAHRFAVVWDESGEEREGVYIPRRDTSSRLSTLLGGRIFPGVHHLASFHVQETSEAFSVALQSNDGETHVHVSGVIAERLPDSSVFASLQEASGFFEAGSLGYSPRGRSGRFDGLELEVKSWSAKALEVSKVSSSYFEDEQKFPSGSVKFDCALLMRNIQHEWLGRDEL